MSAELDNHPTMLSCVRQGLRCLAFYASTPVFAACIAIIGILGVVILALQKLAGRRSEIDDPALEISKVLERAHDAFLIVAGRASATRGGSRPSQQDDLPPADSPTSQDDKDDVAASNCRSDASTFTAHCAAISVPDFLSFLQVNGKSGILRVMSSNEIFSLEIERGELIHATSSNSPPHLLLGEILVAWGYADRNVVASYLDSLPEGVCLGEALERAGVVTREQLVLALQFQAQQLFNRLFVLEDARFSFAARGPREPDSRLRLNITGLLFESARLRDEAA